VLGRRRGRKVKENIVNVSELAAELAQDKKFRRRLLSAIAHGSAAGGRARVGIRSAADRLMTDRQVLSELRAARDDLRRAYTRARAKKRARRFRKLTLLAGLASLLAVPQLRQRLKGLLGKTGGVAELVRPSRLEDLTKDELYARAQEAEIAGRSEMSKEELISALRAQGHGGR